MTDYSIALFLHIVAALGFFAALGAEWTAVRQLRRATTGEQVREWMGVAAGMRRLGMISMLTLLVSGFYMMATVWGGVAWIAVTLAALALLIALALALSGPPMAAIARAMTAENGPLSPSLAALLHDSRLRLGIQTRTAVALGLVFLMTVKPDLVGSLLAIAIAVVLGLASALPMMGQGRAQQEPSA